MACPAADLVADLAVDLMGDLVGGLEASPEAGLEVSPCQVESLLVSPCWEETQAAPPYPAESPSPGWSELLTRPEVAAAT